MDERRQIPRWEIKKQAKVWMPQTQDFSHCMIEDMHLKGMCVSFDKQLPELKPIRMSFAIGDNFDFIKIEAQVSWVKEEESQYVYGLSFSKIDDDDLHKMDQYISANCYDQIKNKWWAGVR